MARKSLPDIPDILVIGRFLSPYQSVDIALRSPMGIIFDRALVPG
jgi:hypothetical protein